jgi:hypothetical protein
MKTMINPSSLLLITRRSVRFDRASSFVRALIGLVLGCLVANATPAADARELNVLFIGNSFTARHELTRVIKTLAEEGQPGLTFNVTTVIYGGRTLAHHWELQTPNFIRQATIRPSEVQVSIALLKEELEKRRKAEKETGSTRPTGGITLQHVTAAVRNQEKLAASLAEPRRKWDVVVLQSYLDDLDAGGRSPFFEFAPKFAAIAQAEGARVILYETTSATQHAKPLTAPPDAAPVLAKAGAIAALAKRIGAEVVPMSLVALRCQQARPELTLRFVNDAHLNQTMAYLTACTFYGTLFHRSPSGLAFGAVTDNRFDDQHKDKDRDGGSLTRIFSAKDRADLQRIAWEGLGQFGELQKSAR